MNTPHEVNGLAATKHGSIILILLSNGNILKYMNERIVAYSNMNPILASLFSVPVYLSNEICFKLDYIYPFIMVSSTHHSKFAIWNMSILTPGILNLNFWIEV